MTEAIREKASARRVLAVLIGLLVTVLALQGIASVKPGGFEAFAQTSPSPGPATIELINPDETTSEEISARSDGANNVYDLVAWVGNPPVNPVVQFKYTPDGTNQPTLSIICSDTGTQNARQVSADTWECEWNLQGVADGGGTLRAELYSEGSGKLAEDEEPVTIDQTGQTVEILYPAQAGPVGFYTGPDGIASGMIEVTTSAANADDTGTNQVNVYYSMAPPGAEPAFELCGSSEITGGGQDSIRCDLAADDPDTVQRENDPSRVTAIAAVAVEVTNGDLPPDPVTGTDPDREEDLDSADAHRAFGYEQEPGSVTATPQTHQAAAGSCSQIITAEVLDTNGRRIVGINVDVHAAGPTDNLFFDDDEAATNTSRHKAPENHETQPSANCEDTEPPPNFNGTQGFHARVEADIKHIESTDATGTDENGRFTFQLYSVDAGATQFTVWADEDGDDLYCQAEAAGIGSIGWNQTPPSPTGVEPAQPCPGPTGTASPTATATATPTQTSTASPTGTTTTTAGPTTDRTVTLSTNKAIMPAGRKVTFSGQIVSNDASCTDDEFVQIRRRIHGTTTFEDLFGTQTDADGRFSVDRRARKSASYIAVAPAHDNCREDTSDEATTLVKVLISILPSDKNPDRGETIRIKSAVKPQHDQTRLILQRKKGDRWVKQAATTMNNRSRGNFWVKARWKSRTFRTLWRSQDEEHESNRSRAVTIRT